MGSGVHKVYREDNQPFTMVPNDAVRNPEITPNAFRLLAYLMSHQDGYSLTYQQIERQTTLKRWAINAAIKLLTEHGYLEVRRPKLSNGQYGPKDWIIKNPATVDDSTVEPSHMETVHSGEINGHKKNTSEEEHSHKKTTSKSVPKNADEYEPGETITANFETRWPGLRLELELQKFRNHNMAKGITFKLWDRAFANWLDRSLEWNPEARKMRAWAEWEKETERLIAEEEGNQ